MTVANKQALLVLDALLLAGEVAEGRSVFNLEWEGDGKASARVDGARENVCERVPDFLTRVPALDDSVNLVEPRHSNRRSSIDGYHHLGGRCGKSGDKTVLSAEKAQSLSVEALRFVALEVYTSQLSVTKTRERFFSTHRRVTNADNGYSSLFRCSHGVSDDEILVNLLLEAKAVRKATSEEE